MNLRSARQPKGHIPMPRREEKSSSERELRNHERHSILKAWSRGAAAGGLVMAPLGAALSMQGIRAGAQSPSPNAFMTDVNSSGAYPSGYGAGSIEGLGMIGSPGCDYGPYQPPAIARTADAWINAGERTIIEVSPQTVCTTSTTDYINAIGELTAAIALGASSSAQFSTYWGGVMLDEEPGFGFGASDLQTLNTGVYNSDLVGGKLFTESFNEPGAWTQAQWESITWGTGSIYIPAPQIYNSNMTAYTNQAFADGYSSGQTDVTCDQGLSAPYNSCSYASNVIGGVPWNWSNWAGDYWENKFVAA